MLGGFAGVLDLAGAYWRGNEKNPQLQRLYGDAFATKEELEQYLFRIEEAKKRDHRRLGPQLDLFTFSELVGPGLPLFTPKGTLGTASSAAGDLGLNVLKSGGTVTVSAADPSASWAHTSGLSALNNIDMYGVDAAGANAPPGYTSGALANLGGGSKTFTYTQGQNPSQNYTANVAQTRVVQPPAIRQDQLPGQNSPATVNAGTYVVWNGGLYYYGTDYDSSKALTSQPWSQTDPTQPPKYNNVAGTAVNIDSTGKMAFDANTNTLTVQKDVLVQKANGLNNFSLVVAPSQYDGGSLQSTIDSNAVGSAQIQFTPATTQATTAAAMPSQMSVRASVRRKRSTSARGRLIASAPATRPWRITGTAVKSTLISGASALPGSSGGTRRTRVAACPPSASSISGRAVAAPTWRATGTRISVESMTLPSRSTMMRLSSEK